MRIENKKSFIYRFNGNSVLAVDYNTKKTYFYISH